MTVSTVFSDEEIYEKLTGDIVWTTEYFLTYDNKTKEILEEKFIKPDTIPEDYDGEPWYERKWMDHFTFEKPDILIRTNEIYYYEVQPEFDIYEFKISDGNLWYKRNTQFPEFELEFTKKIIGFNDDIVVLEASDGEKTYRSCFYPAPDVEQ